MQTTLENKNKVVADSPRSALKRKNKVEEKGASCLRVKKEQESTNVRAQKMMKGRVEQSRMPTMAWVVPIVVVQAIRLTTKVPQMTSTHERQLREERQEVPQMTSPQE